jgi:alpha-glucosidase
MLPTPRPFDDHAPPRFLPLVGWRLDQSPTLIGDNILRFRDPAFASVPIPPFPAFVTQPRPPSRNAKDAAQPPRLVLRPAFRRHANKSIVSISLPPLPGVSIYGTGEQAGALLRNGTRKTLWNSDSFDYTDKTRSLYQSHPYVLIVLPTGESYGVIVESTYPCEIDLRRSCLFQVRGPSPAVTIIRRSHPQQVVEALSDLTGKAPMPPKWAFGYHQCRWSYEPESRVREIASEFRNREIPCDVIWLDIDYMDRFRCFTHDPKKFPNPARMNADLKKQGFKTVYMIDPGLAADEKYAPFAAGLHAGHFIKRGSPPVNFASAIPDDLAAKWGLSKPLAKDAFGDTYLGQVWPGSCAFPDFTRAKVRAWWASLYREFLTWGMDGVWNDMNEPAVFDGPNKSMPLDNPHDADEELGGPGTHAKYHNIYGMLMARATREGIAAARPDNRPFVLTRANFLGGQRYAAMWTGDNRSDWNHLRWSIPMVLNMGLSGQPMAGPDIGGFIGDATPDLFAAWMGIGALLPFCRAHSDKNSGPHEPWAFGKSTESASRLALRRRMMLMPYLYTVANASITNGLPIARPVFFADPADPRLRAIDDAFLIGDDLLVVSDTSRERFAEAPPTGSPTKSLLHDWVPFDPLTLEGPLSINEANIATRYLPHLFARPGSVIPLGPAMQHVDQKPLDLLTLVIAPDRLGHAEGLLHEDAGDGVLSDSTAFRRTVFSASVEQGNCLVKEIHAGNFRAPKRTRRDFVLQSPNTLN